MEAENFGNEQIPAREYRSATERLEDKIESNNQKILYLVKRIRDLDKGRNGTKTNGVTSDRLRTVAEKLRDKGLMIEYADGRGYLKLKAVDQRGIDHLRKLNTLFTVDHIESFLENG